MRHMLCTLVAAILTTASATSYASPEPRVIGSRTGGYGFIVTPKGINKATASAKENTGELFQVQRDGTKKVLWRHSLPNTPLKILISPLGQVVTIDTWAGNYEGKHIVVIYDPKGKLVADLSFKQVMNGNICHTCQSMDGPFLADSYKIDLVNYNKFSEWFLFLKDETGSGIVISLNTGKHKTK